MREAMGMKIVIYCSADHPVFFKELVLASKGVDWFAIVPTYHFKEEFELLLGKGRVLYVPDKMNAAMDAAVFDPEAFRSYVGSIYADIASGIGSNNVTIKPKDYQVKSAYCYYSIFKDFLSRIKPDAILMPLLDIHESVILYKTCKELGVEVVMPAHARNLGRSFFTDSAHEAIPEYALSRPKERFLQEAKAYLEEFRSKFKKPMRNNAYAPREDELIAWKRKSLYEKAMAHLANRILPNREPHFITDSRMRAVFGRSMFAKKLRSAKWAIARRFAEISKIEQLPAKFIYFPLQYTPESSINIPAPFFFDQLRAIDLILYSMPSDRLLVVKEHPAMKGMRTLSFYQELKKKPGVVTADASMPSTEIIRKTELTVSVTGTACLEAFLMGRPAMHLSKTFFSRWLSQPDMNDLGKSIRDAMSHRAKDSEVLDMIATVFSVSGDFVCYSPSDMDMGTTKYLMNRHNVTNFLEALLRHLEEVKKHRKSHPNTPS